MKRVVFLLAAALIGLSLLAGPASAGWYSVSVQNDTDHEMVVKLDYRDWKPMFGAIFAEGKRIPAHSSASISPPGAFCPAVVTFELPAPDCRACRVLTHRAAFGCWGRENSPADTCCVSSSWVVKEIKGGYDIRKR